MDSLVNCIQADRRANYSPEKFESLFDKFDMDKNNFLTKAEMAVLIKKTFAGPSAKPQPSSTPIKS